MVITFQIGPAVLGVEAAVHWSQSIMLCHLQFEKVNLERGNLVAVI